MQMPSAGHLRGHHLGEAGPALLSQNAVIQDTCRMDQATQGVL